MNLRLPRTSRLALALVVFLSCAVCIGATPSRVRATAEAVKSEERNRAEFDSVLKLDSAPDASKTSAQTSNGKTAQGKGQSNKNATQKKNDKQGKKNVAKASAPKAQDVVEQDEPRGLTYYLNLEQKARRAEFDVVKGLWTNQRFSRRLPAHWSKVNVTDEQRAQIYAVQEAYFLEIAQLEARAERLKKEREAAMLSVLTPRQRMRLQELLNAVAGRGVPESFEIKFDDEE